MSYLENGFSRVSTCIIDSWKLENCRPLENINEFSLIATITNTEYSLCDVKQSTSKARICLFLSANKHAFGK
jgi:hypothetical protein